MEVLTLSLLLSVHVRELNPVRTWFMLEVQLPSACAGIAPAMTAAAAHPVTAAIILVYALNIPLRCYAHDTLSIMLEFMLRRPAR